MYEDRSGNRLTLYVTTRQGREEAALGFQERGRLRALVWVDKQLAVAVTADVGSDRLRGISQIVAATLRLREPT